MKSVNNIQKITKSMKMVSAAKYARAERELKPARPYGAGATGLCRIIQLYLIFCCEHNIIFDYTRKTVNRYFYANKTDVSRYTMEKKMMCLH